MASVVHHSKGERAVLISATLDTQIEEGTKNKDILCKKVQAPLVT